MAARLELNVKSVTVHFKLPTAQRRRLSKSTYGSLISVMNMIRNSVIVIGHQVYMFSVGRPGKGLAQQPSGIP